MNRRHLSSSARPVVIAMLCLAAVAVAAQGTAPVAAPRGSGASTPAPPRMPDGHPDLQGTWNYGTLTPLERPAELAGKATLSDEDVARAEAESKELATEKVKERKTNLTRKFDTTARPGDVGFYNQSWFEQGNTVLATRQTSLIVDPPDGRLPLMTPQGQQRLAGIRAGKKRNAGPEDRPPRERCITGFNDGPPMLPAAYSNLVGILQAPGYVTIHNEMVHTVRVVPMDGRPHGTTRQWVGDPRGRWEGDTLVVDSINFRNEGIGADEVVGSADENLHLVERFRRLDEDTLLYEATVDDPTVWTRPWTVSFTLQKSDERIFEYACHEGNYAMEGILGGAREDERKAADATSGRRKK